MFLQLRSRLELWWWEWRYGRVHLSADFIYRPMSESYHGDADPLDRYWTFAWKMKKVRSGRVVEEYGNYIAGTAALTVDPLLLDIAGSLLTQSLNVAYELGKEDANPFLRWWRNHRRKSIRRARLKEGVPNEEFDYEEEL